jgi:NTE family protein
VKRALVLAGGGVAGIAWELGVLQGIGDADAALQTSIVDADVVVGTSAGSTVAAQITSGTTLDDLFAAQLRDDSNEMEVELNLDELMARFAAAVKGATGPEDMRRRIGALALETPTVSEAVRRAIVASRLPEASWPDRTVLISAVEAGTGAFTVFTRESEVSLLDAVSASCAVPGIWPPVTIGGLRYIDGGMRSVTNADLAAGCDRVLIITPSQPDVPSPWGGDLDDEITQLQPAAVHVIYADEATTEAFGTNPLSPTTRKPAALAGRDIGRGEAAFLRSFWD